MIALDTTALTVLFVEGASICRAGTSIPIRHAKARLDALVERIAQSQEQLLISTPALSELLVRVPLGKIDELMAHLRGSHWFRIESFDTAAALEVAIRLAKAIASGDKREGLPVTTPWSKVKLDRQIVSVAIVNGAAEIISDDPDIKSIGERWKLKVSSVEDLPVPPHLIPPPLLAGLDDEETPQT